MATSPNDTLSPKIERPLCLEVPHPPQKKWRPLFVLDSVSCNRKGTTSLRRRPLSLRHRPRESSTTATSTDERMPRPTFRRLHALAVLGLAGLALAAFKMSALSFARHFHQTIIRRPQLMSLHAANTGGKLLVRRPDRRVREQLRPRTMLSGSGGGGAGAPRRRGARPPALSDAHTCGSPTWDADGDGVHATRGLFGGAARACSGRRAVPSRTCHLPHVFHHSPLQRPPTRPPLPRGRVAFAVLRRAPPSCVRRETCLTPSSSRPKRGAPVQLQRAAATLVQG